jgi:hypothetical protein
MLNWDKKETSEGVLYTSISGIEFSIFKENNYWILRYTDYWSVENTSFFVNIKSMSDSDFSVSYLKKYAEQIYENKSKIMENEPFSNEWSIGEQGKLVDLFNENLTQEEWNALCIVHRLSNRLNIRIRFDYEKSIDVKSKDYSQIIDETVFLSKETSITNEKVDSNQNINYVSKEFLLEKYENVGYLNFRYELSDSVYYNFDNLEVYCYDSHNIQIRKSFDDVLEDSKKVVICDYQTGETFYYKK